jgi:hypothetical protein
MSKTVTLLRELRQFQTPDTVTPYVGTLAAATYPVSDVEVRGTDEYVQVTTWICSKSNGVTYAVVDEVVPPVTDGISEKALTDTLQRFRGYVYASGNPRYTGSLPNTVVPLVPPKQDDCCTFVEDLVVHAFQAAGFAFVWDQHRHEQLVVADWNNLWSPPQGLAESGLARAVVGPSSSTPFPQPWTVCQAWSPSSGHSFIVMATHAPTGKVLILESNYAFGFSGPGLRGLGGLDQYLTSGPPANWYTDPEVPTWDQVKERYSTGIAYAQLKILTDTLQWGKSVS